MEKTKLEQIDERTNLAQILAIVGDVQDYIEEAEDHLMTARAILRNVNILVSKEIENIRTSNKESK